MPLSEPFIKRIVLPFGFDGNYTTNSPTFAMARFNICIGDIEDYFDGASSISCSLCADVKCDGGSTGELALVSINNLGVASVIAGSETPITNTTYTPLQTALFSINPNTTFRVVIRKTSGINPLVVYIRAAQLILTFE